MCVSGDELRLAFIGLVMVYAVTVFLKLTRAIAEGSPFWAAFWALLASPVPMAVVGMVVEVRHPATLFAPSTQSWAFIFGDTVFLPFMAAMLAVAWQKIDGYPAPEETGKKGAPWYRQSGWRWACAVIGLAAGWIFHLVDMGNYTPLAANSPGKWVHDLGAYATLFGALFFGLVPAFLRRSSRKLAMVALIGFSLWLGGGVADQVRQLDGKELHIQFDWDKWKQIPY